MRPSNFLIASLIFVAGCGASDDSAPPAAPPSTRVTDSPDVKFARPQNTFATMQAAMAAKDFSQYCQCFTPEAQELLAGKHLIESKLSMMLSPTSGEWERLRAEKTKAALASQGIAPEEAFRISINFGDDEGEHARARQLAAKLDDHCQFIVEMMEALATQPGYGAIPADMRPENVSIDGDSATAVIVATGPNGEEFREPREFKQVDEAWLFHDSRGESDGGTAAGPASNPATSTRREPIAGGAGEAPDTTGDRVLDKLLARVRDPDAKVRYQGLIDLGARAERSRDVALAAMPVFQVLLEHDDLETRVFAINLLGDIGDARAYRTADLQGTDNPLLVHEGVLPALARTLADPEEAVRETTPRQLGKIVEYNLPAAELIIAEVVPLLTSQQAGTRAAAAEALRHCAGRLGKTQQGLPGSGLDRDGALAQRIGAMFQAGVEPLRNLVNDTDEEARREATDALEAIDRLK